MVREPPSEQDKILFRLRLKDLEAIGINVATIDEYYQLEVLLKQLIARCRPCRLFIAGSPPEEKPDIGDSYPSIDLPEPMSDFADQLGAAFEETSVALSAGASFGARVAVGRIRAERGRCRSASHRGGRPANQSRLAPRSRRVVESPTRDPLLVVHLNMFFCPDDRARLLSATGQTPSCCVPTASGGHCASRQDTRTSSTRIDARPTPSILQRSGCQFPRRTGGLPMARVAASQRGSWSHITLPCRPRRAIPPSGMASRERPRAQSWAPPLPWAAQQVGRAAGTTSGGRSSLTNSARGRTRSCPDRQVRWLRAAGVDPHQRESGGVSAWRAAR